MMKGMSKLYYLPIPTIYPYAYGTYSPAYMPRHSYGKKEQPKDHGSQPFVVNIEEAAKQNHNFRTALWTGEYLQVTLMSIDVGDDIGLEVHHDHDQFLRIEAGQGLVQMGDREDHLDFERRVYADYAIMVPAGKWHNLTNVGNRPLKLYSIYAPPEHPFGTVHETKEIAMAAEDHY
ncbi:cupin domain-containing protein [Natribacillus halophilus]|uniref:Mannose-6-phosphate isomerase, cupin superfamily n=1 Tax=Natribacillus halophilus TaxID=549003 RepID=A0A1G8LCR0_9BACI|nr:cupin domain-containing protein [Natribacillus halophilus]SDI53237.1 Mannose-6-phosphate isomerase, cupin superfamily [Natribacillus halophilus]